MSAGNHSFETLFDQSPHVVAHASGVVPLAGDLGDSALALAVSVPLATHVLVARRRDPVVHAASANVDGPARSVYVLEEETPWSTWVDCVQGVTIALREAGHTLSGFDLLVRSDVPVGIGAGASTAVVVATLRAVRDAHALQLDDATLVTLALRAENAFGERTSRAAVEACVFASERHALLLESGVARERIALPEDCETSLLFGRSPAERAANDDAPEIAAARVEELAAALRAGAAEEIGALLETMPAPRCELLATARRHPAVYGARCVKEGGAVVALVRRGAARSLRAA